MEESEGRGGTLKIKEIIRWKIIQMRIDGIVKQKNTKIVATDSGGRGESLTFIQIEARTPLYTKALAWRVFLASREC